MTAAEVVWLLIAADFDAGVVVVLVAAGASNVQWVPEEQGVGDLLVGSASGDEAEHIKLAVGQFAETGRGPGAGRRAA